MAGNSVCTNFYSEVEKINSYAFSGRWKPRSEFRSQSIPAMSWGLALYISNLPLSGVGIIKLSRTRSLSPRDLVPSDLPPFRITTMYSHGGCASPSTWTCLSERVSFRIDRSALRRRNETNSLIAALTQYPLVNADFWISTFSLFSIERVTTSAAVQTNES